MKILLASASSGSRGGGELCLLYLARALVQCGHEVSLWMSAHPRMDELAALFAPIGTVIRADYTNTYDYRARSLAHFFSGGTARRIASQWRAIAPDVIHINKQNLEDGLDLLDAARRSGIPSLATIHITQSAGYLRARHAWARDWIARRFLRRFPGVLVPTLEQRERELRAVAGPAARIRTVLNGVPLPDLSARPAVRDAARAELGVAAGETLFVGVGRVVAQKRPQLWLDWSATVRRGVPGARFVWVGDGALAGDFDRLVNERGLSACVRRVPWTNDVTRHLFAGDAFLHTAEFEGLSFAMLEALAAALPVIVSENLLAELPFLTPEVSVSLRPGCESVLADRTALAALGANARRLAVEKFSFGTMAANYVRLYGEIMQRRA
jgi:glycosyltransferase involved in cell wall biosynthesis